jgi:hypothetical protein
MDLLQLFKDNDYQKFCLNYEQGISIDLDKFHEQVDLNIPYIEFILNHQKENYDLSYIEYLVENYRSDIAINFFESIKDIKDDSESHNCSRLLEIICKNKDIDFFRYVSTSPIAKLSKFNYQVNLFEIFLREGFKEAVELVAKRMPNPHMLLIDNTLNKGCVLSREEFLELDIDYSFIPNKKLLQSILLDYYESSDVAIHREIVRSYQGLDKEQMINSTPGHIMDRAVFSSIATGKPTMSSDKLKAYLSKQKLQVHFKSDQVTKSIWKKYKLEVALKEKDTIDKKETKI